MAELFVRAALPNLDKSKPRQDGNHLVGLQNGDSSHAEVLGHNDGLRADKLTFQLGLPVLQQHVNHFPKIRP